MDKIKEMRDEGKSLATIAKKFGIKITDALALIKGHSSFDVRPVYDKVDEKVIECMKTMYTDGVSSHKIAKELDLSRSTVKRHLVNSGVWKDSTATDYVKKRRVKHVMDWRKRAKLKLVEYKGGKCVKCGYSKCVEALIFHHVNPEEKDFNISGKSFGYARLQKEVDKCILVCSNCHHEIHAGILET